MQFTSNSTEGTLDQASTEDTTNPLDQYSLYGSSAELVAQKMQEVPVLKGIALFGQATVIYAPPNTGKTLVSLALLKEAIEHGRIHPKNVYYINMDDTFNGLAEKSAFADANGFQYLARGQKGFEVESLRTSMATMIAEDTAKGCVVLLDTLKKFTDLMDKTKSSSFADLVRAFVSKGGTVIAFAHTNKNLGVNGRNQYGGTSDIIDDFDCGFIMEEVSIEGKDDLKVVEFRNVKMRGAVDELKYYEYLSGSDVPYAGKLASVREVLPEELELLKAKVQMSRDGDAIDAICKLIGEGVIQKMELAKKVGDITGLSRQTALKVLDRYTGTDQACHLWTVRTAARGAKLYKLLPGVHVAADDSEY